MNLLRKLLHRFFDYTVSCDVLKINYGGSMDKTGLYTAAVQAITVDGIQTTATSLRTFIQGSNPAAYITQKSVMIKVTEAQVLALNTTPVKIVDPAGANLGVIIENVTLYKKEGSSYQIGDATDISIGYLGGEALTTLEKAAGLFGPVGAAISMLVSVGKTLIPLANEGLYLNLAGGNITGSGDGLVALINYKIIPTTLS